MPVIQCRADSLKDDPRPAHGGYFGCRMTGVRVLDDDEDEGYLKLTQLSDTESVLTWDCKSEEK